MRGAYAFTTSWPRPELFTGDIQEGDGEHGEMWTRLLTGTSSLGPASQRHLPL